MRQQRSLRLLTVKAGIALSLLGCSNAGTLPESTKAYEKADKIFHDGVHRVEADRRARDAYAIGVQPDAMWVSTNLIRSNHIMPVSLQKSRYSFVRGFKMTLKDLSSYVTQVTGVNVRRAPELIEKRITSSASTTVDGSSVQPIADPSQQQNTSDNDNELAEFIPTDVYRPNLTNVTLAEAMDVITQELGIYWRYSRSEGITLYYFDTASFTINESTKTQTITKTSTTGQSGSQTDTGSVDNSSSLTVAQEIRGNFWAEAKPAIMEMRSNYGRIVVNTGAGGHIHVTDSPDVIAQVGKYVEEQNRRFEREARIQLMIVNVRKSSTDNFGLNLNIVQDRVNRELFNLTTTRGAIDGGSGLSVQNNRQNAFNGSQLFLDALSTQGKVSVLRTEEFPVSNYNAYNHKIGGVSRFLSQASTSDTGDDIVADNVIEDLFEGRGVALLPKIQSPQRASFEIFIDESSIASTEEITLGDGLISNAPQTLNDEYSNTLSFRNGQSRVLLNYTFERSNRSDSYTLKKTSCITGCNKESEYERNYLLYVMTTWIQ
ncbi:hypothetical protein AB835_08080 [Candidatus Endobugula sertula]|uniref:Secretin N-terminal domain-containing protein n=1 Tax=Candidatus Endobugula sertula TaxID=62101 RepID=A0A1D2QPQ9_9GAMM|nr:hypothetical protein AB835_08080 [Candidatus Endobugula sertula]